MSFHWPGACTVSAERQGREKGEVGRGSRLTGFEMQCYRLLKHIAYMNITYSVILKEPILGQSRECVVMTIP